MSIFISLLKTNLIPIKLYNYKTNVGAKMHNCVTHYGYIQLKLLTWGYLQI